MKRRDALAQIGLTTGAVLSGGSIARAEDGTEDKLQESTKSKVETVELPAGLKKTKVNFRLVATVEDGSKVTKVLDMLFNGDGQLVEAKTTDAKLKSKIKERLYAKGTVDECYNRCRHHLDNGNAPAYAVCFYACLAEP